MVTGWRWRAEFGAKRVATVGNKEKKSVVKIRGRGVRRGGDLST